jgi:hypothetical protein
VVIATLGVVRSAIAQTGVAWAMDASVGPTYGVGGDFASRSNPLAEVAVSFRRDTRRGLGIDAEIGDDRSAILNGELVPEERSQIERAGSASCHLCVGLRRARSTPNRSRLSRR